MVVHAQEIGKWVQIAPEPEPEPEPAPPPKDIPFPRNKVIPADVKVITHPVHQARINEGTEVVIRLERYSRIIAQVPFASSTYIGFYLEPPFFPEKELHLFEVSAENRHHAKYHKVGQLYARAFLAAQDSYIQIEYHFPPGEPYDTWVDEMVNAGLKRSTLGVERRSAYVLWEPEDGTVTQKKIRGGRLHFLSDPSRIEKGRPRNPDSCFESRFSALGETHCRGVIYNLHLTPLRHKRRKH